MRAVALIISLSLVVCCALAANPCDTTLDAIQSAMASANTHRQACEKSFFSASACDSYWTAVNQILTMQINYQDCGRKTQDKFYSDVKTNVATEGTNTRTSVSTNAQTTQNTVNTQHTTTRSHVTAEATRTVSQVNAETDSQNDQTRRLVSDESTTTRTLISNEHAKTNTFIDNNTTTILSTTVTQATTTRQEVDAQHAQTRSTLTQVIQTEGVDTRTNTDQEAETTRTLIKAEAKATRDTVEADGVATRDYVASQAEKTRTNTTNEASATRTTVTNQHGQTRTAVNAARDDVKSTVSTTATATQNTVTTQGSATRKQVSDEAANTNQVITNAFNANTASLNTLQSTQNNFTSLFIQLFIMMDFSSSGARVDLFQRPASQGGYFETMRAVVRNVIDTNKSLYSWTSYKIGAAETYWAAGEGYYGQSKPDYRRAWEAYRAAYLYATNSN